MCGSQRQWDTFGSGGPLKGPLPSRRLISRQSSTTSTSTSRSSGVMGDAAAGKSSSDFNPDRCQFIADTLLESMDVLGAQGSLDIADRYYLEKIFQRVLDWNNVIPVSTSKTAAADNVHSGHSKHSKKLLSKHEGHRDANSPRSHAALRERLLKLKHNEKSHSSPHHPQQADVRLPKNNSNPHTRRRRDLILPDEDDADKDSRKHPHPLQSSGKRGGIKRQTSHSSRDTSASSRAFSDNSVSKHSYVSSMSSFSMDNGSLRGSVQGNTETQQQTHHPSLATFLPQYSIQPAGSFESTASSPDRYLRSQTCATSHAERVLMGLGFGAAEGFLPERFLKDWYSKISKAQMESAVNAELKRQESLNNPSNPADVNNQRYSQTLKNSSTSNTLHEASADLPPANDQCTKLERLKEYIAAYTNNMSSIDEEKEMTMRQSSFSRQKSLPLCLETLSKLEGKSRLSGIDPFDKEAKLQMFISDNTSNDRKHVRPEYSPHGGQSQWDPASSSSQRLNTDSQEHRYKQTTHKHLNTQIEETIGSLKQIIQRQLLNSDLSDTPEETRANSEICNKHTRQHFTASKQMDGTSSRSPRNFSSKTSSGSRPPRSPKRQVAIDVCEPVCKADRSDTQQHNITERCTHKEAVIKTFVGNDKNVPGIYQTTPHKIESLLSKDSEEVANIMQNQPSRDQHVSSENQHQNKVNGGHGRHLKSALKHVEPAMISIVLEDTDQGEGRCNADILSVSQEGIHLVIPLSACNSSSLSPFSLSPVTVIEVSLDNQQDSLDTEGTYSSKDTDDDSLNHPTVFYCGDYNAMKPNHDRRRSLISLCPKPEHPQRRRSTGIISPIPCQLSLTQVPNSNKEGPSRRRMSLEIPATPEIRHLLRKQKGLSTSQSKDNWEEPKKGREKRRASFSEAEPIIINEVLARQRCFPRDLSNFDSTLQDIENQDVPSGSQDVSAEEIAKATSIIQRNGSEEIPDVASSEKYTIESSGREKDKLSTSDQHLRDYIERKDDAHLILEKNITNLNANTLHECELKDMKSSDCSARSAKSAFKGKIASKRTVENSPSSCNGYFSETDAEEFPVSVNPKLQPRPISGIAKYLEAETNSIEGELQAPSSHNVSKSMESKSSSPVLQFRDYSPALNISEDILHKKVKAPMISRAVEVNTSTFPYTTLNTQDGNNNNNQRYSSEYYYACDKSTQCCLIESGYEIPPHTTYTFISKSTQTGIDKHEVSCQTTDVFYFVNSGFKIPTGNDNSESKGVNTVVCLIGREHSNNYLKCSTKYTAANFNSIDETLREIDAELSNIDIRSYQRSLGIHGVQSVERSYPSLPGQGLTDCVYHRTSSNYYGYQAERLVARERQYKHVLNRCVPSNWQDAIAGFTHSSLVGDNTRHGRTVEDDKHGFHGNERKIIVNDYKRETNMSLRLGAGIIPSNACAATEFSDTCTYCEEGKQIYSRNVNTDLHSPSSLKSSENSTHDSYPTSTASNTLHNNRSAVGNGNNLNTPLVKLISQLHPQTYTHEGGNKTDCSAHIFKASNELPLEQIANEYTASESNDITVKTLDSCSNKVLDIQSNVCEHENNQDRDVTASNIDLSANRNVSTRQKLFSTTQMTRMDSSDTTQILQLLAGKEQTDKGHSKLSRLKYNQSSHRSSGSSFDIELDFMKAGEPIGMFKYSEGISQVLQDCKRQVNKQLDQVETAETTKNARNNSESNTEEFHIHMPANVSNTPRTDEHSWNVLSSTTTDTVVKIELRNETLPDKDTSRTVENILIDTDDVAYHSSAAEAVVSTNKPFVSNISKIQLDNYHNRKRTAENVLSNVQSINMDFLQVPGSPDHLFNRARYPSVSRTSSPSTSSSATQIQEIIAPMTVDNSESVTQTATNSTAIADRSDGLKVLLAIQQLEDREGSERQGVLMHTSVGSAKVISDCRSVEQSFDKYSDASMYPILSNDSVVDGHHVEDTDINIQGNGHNMIDLDKVSVGSFEVIATYPPVFDPDIFNINHKMRRSQSVGDWPVTFGGQETGDMDSNKSVVGSELHYDIANMDVLSEDSRKPRSNSDSSYSEPLLDLSDTLSQDSDSNGNMKKDLTKTYLLTAGYNTDDLLQVSDFGNLSPTSRKSPAGENHSLSPSNSIRSPERHNHSPSCKSVRSPSREFPPEPIQCDDSDDELDSETELKIRERLRQVRRESRRNSKDNWDAVQSVLLSHNKVSDDGVPYEEETSRKERGQSDIVISVSTPHIVVPGDENKCPIDDSSDDECNQEISRINLNQPIMRKLIKMSSDPVDKDMYCRSLQSLTAKDKTAQWAQNSPVLEETLRDFENGGVSGNVHTLSDGLQTASLSQIRDHSMSGTMSAALTSDLQLSQSTDHSVSDTMNPALTSDLQLSQSTDHSVSVPVNAILTPDLQLLENNSQACEDSEIQKKADEDSCSLINDQIDLNASSHKWHDDGNAARILGIEFDGDDMEKDTKDGEDGLQEPSSNILDELEIIALFNKIDGYESSVHPHVDYSSESSSSVEFKLSQISEEDTQSEGSTSDESRRHIWHVRSRFVFAQDTQESTLDSNTRQESLSSRSSYQSGNSEILPHVEETSEESSRPDVAKSTHESGVNENTLTHNQHMIDSTSNKRNELLHVRYNSNDFPAQLDSSNEKLNTGIDEILPHPHSDQLEQHRQINDFTDSGHSEIPNSQKSPATYSKLDQCVDFKKKLCTSEDSYVFCNLSPTATVVPTLETQILERKTDATGSVSTKITNTRVVKTLHLNSNHNTHHETNTNRNSVSEMSEVEKHTVTMEFVVGDHRRQHDKDSNDQHMWSDQLPVENQAFLATVSNNKYGTVIEDNLAEDESCFLCGNNSLRKVTDNTVESEDNSKISGTSTDTCHHEEVCMGGDFTGNLSPDFVNDSKVCDTSFNNRTTFLETDDQDNICSFQKDFKNKIREKFLIDSVAMSKDTIQDNIAAEESCIDRTREDLKDKVRSLFLIDRVAMPGDIIQDNTTTNEGRIGRTREDLKNKVRAWFLIDSVAASGETLQDHAITEESCIDRTQEDLKDNVRSLFLIDSVVTSRENTQDNAVTEGSCIDRNRDDLKDKVRSLFLIDSVISSRDTTHDNTVTDESSIDRTGEDLKGTLRSRFLIDSGITSRETIHDNVITEERCVDKTQEDLKDMVRSRFLIDSGTTARETIQDNTITDESCIDRSKEDLKDKVRSLFLIDHVAMPRDIIQDNTTTNEGRIGRTREDLKNKVRAWFLIDSVAASGETLQDNAITEESCIDRTQEDLKDKVRSRFLIDSLATSRENTQDNAITEERCIDKTQEDLKDKVRSLFLIDSGATARETIQDNTITDESCIDGSQEDLKDKIRSRFLIDRVISSRGTTQDNTITDESSNDRTREDLKDKVRASFLIDSVATSGETIQDNVITDETCVDRTQKDLKDKVLSRFLFGSGITSSETIHDNTITDESCIDKTQENFKDKVRSRFLIDSVATSSENARDTAITEEGNIDRSEEDLKDNVLSRFLKDSVISSRDTTQDNTVTEESSIDITREDLKDKVRSLFLIDSGATARATIQDNTITDESCIDRIQEDLQDKVRSLFLIDSASTSRNVIHDNNLTDESCIDRTQEDLQDKVRSLFLIDSASTSRNVIHDNNLTDESCIDRTQEDLQNKVRSRFLIGSGITSRETIQDNTINDESCSDGCHEDLKDKVRALFLIGTPVAQTISQDIIVNSSSKHNDDSKVQEDLTAGEETSPVLANNVNTESTFRDSTELSNKGNTSVKSKMSVSQKVLSMFFSDTVDSEDSFEGSSEFIGKDYRLNESATEKSLTSNVNSMLGSVNSCCEDILTDHTNYNGVDCNISSSLPLIHSEETISSVFHGDAVLLENMYKESTRRNSMHSVNLNTHILTRDICVTDDASSVSEYGSILLVSDVDTHANENDTIPFTRSVTENACDRNKFQENNSDMLTDNSTSGNLDDSEPKCIPEADIKKRVRAMFLLNREDDSSSSDSKPVDIPASSQLSSPPSPAKSIVNVSTVFSEDRDRTTSFVTSSFAVCVDRYKEELNKPESLSNSIVSNSGTQVHIKETKDLSSRINRRANKNSRVLKFRNSLLRLHEQLNVFSSIGSDSDSELTSALKNQGDYDSRMSDLVIHNSSDKYNDEETGLSTDSCNNLRPGEGIPADNISSCIILQEVSNMPTNPRNRLEYNESDSLDTLVNSASVISDVAGSSSGTNASVTPTVVIQQPSEEEPTLKHNMTHCTSETTVSDSNEPDPSDAKESVNQKENYSRAGERRHCAKRFSARPGFSSPWLRNNPHANFLTPERALTRTPQYSPVTNQGHYTRIQDDSHPELSYLDIVSKLKQQEVYKSIPVKQSVVELVISSPDTKDKHQLKSVRFALSENISPTMRSGHKEDTNSTEVT